jgi:hypothetical protein
MTSDVARADSRPYHRILQPAALQWNGALRGSHFGRIC